MHCRWRSGLTVSPYRANRAVTDEELDFVIEQCRTNPESRRNLENWAILILADTVREREEDDRFKPGADPFHQWCRIEHVKFFLPKGKDWKVKAVLVEIPRTAKEIELYLSVRSFTEYNVMKDSAYDDLFSSA